MRLRSNELLGCLFGVVCGFSAVGLALLSPAASQSADDARLRAEFRRPQSVPLPANARSSPEIIALGERLFNDPRLSGNGKIACSTCHDFKLGLSDGAQTSTAGSTGKALARHTPALWNLAWSPLLMWDGRADGLEMQAALPMSHPDEMSSNPERAAEALRTDPEMVRLFATAYPEKPAVSADTLVRSLAAFERTLVSPPTRFDRWVAGDASALTQEEREGLAIFTGKAHCSSCHSGFSFTDHAFHDIGLPSSDLGRGPIANLPAVNHAFKTPTLRELSWTAPYMHDGSLATLEDVVRFYETGGVRRASRSKDLPTSLKLDDDERAALVAFLESLSSDAPPRASTEPWVRMQAAAAPTPAAIGTTAIHQRDKLFLPSAIKIRRGESITVSNDDTRTHNVRIVSPLLDFNSGAQEPGENVVLKLTSAGTFEAHCAIHPSMRLRIEVE